MSNTVLSKYLFSVFETLVNWYLLLPLVIHSILRVKRSWTKIDNANKLSDDRWYIVVFIEFQVLPFLRQSYQKI